jgi:hypothetical protein
MLFFREKQMHLLLSAEQHASESNLPCFRVLLLTRLLFEAGTKIFLNLVENGKMNKNIWWKTTNCIKTFGGV